MLDGHVQRLNQALDEIVPEVQDLEDAQDGSQEKANDLQRLTNRSTDLSRRRDAYEKMHQKAAEIYRTQTGNVWHPRDIG